MTPKYQRVAVASTFSPRFLAVLRESHFLVQRLGATLTIVHGDVESGEKHARFLEALDTLQRPRDTPIFWAREPSCQPAVSIVEACREAKVDLLVAGALERENDHRFFLGGVARSLLQNAPCDLLLMTAPSEDERILKHVVIEVDIAGADRRALQKCLDIASKLGASRVTFLSVSTPFEEVIDATSSNGQSREDALFALVDPLGGFDGDVDVQVIRSTTGFGACDFVTQVRADLLVVITATRDGIRSLPPHMDWLLQVIPTNLLLFSADTGE